jgi:hypothetical protein
MTPKKTKRQKPCGAHSGPESRFQSSTIKLMRHMAGQGVIVCHIPNGRNAGSSRMGGWWKDQGVVSGLPDCMMFMPRNAFTGLAIELKVWPNKLSDEQVAVHEVLRKAGWQVAVCYGTGEVEQAVREYLQ